MTLSGTRIWRPGAGLAAAMLIALSMLLSACDSGIEGAFEDELGVMRYDFKSDGRVELTVMGAQVAGEYELDGDRIVVIGPHGRIEFRREGPLLKGPMGLVLTPVARN